jgi:hypothetical protein
MDPSLDPGDLLLYDCTKIGTFRKVLTHKAVYMLIQASFPGMIGLLTTSYLFNNKPVQTNFFPMIRHQSMEAGQAHHRLLVPQLTSLSHAVAQPLGV